MLPSKRKVLTGTAISSGIVLGTARVIMPGETEIAELHIPASRVKDEIDALEKAIASTITELRQLRESAGKKMGGPVAKIFDAQLLVASDYDFLNRVKSEIQKYRRNAGYIYNRLVKEATLPLKKSPDEYMRQMSLDIEAVAGRVLSHLSGAITDDIKFPPHTILVGKSFSPGEILSYRQRKAIGFLISEGGRNSHMALIARGLMMPVVLSKNIHLDITDDCRLIVDGIKGEVIISPTDDEWSRYQKIKKKQGPATITRLKRLTKIPPVTADGKTVPVGANLTLPGPADDILSACRFPVGLYRTEFLYLAHNDFPDEDTQTGFYTEIAEHYKNSHVVLRTFDLGYDKLALNGNWPQENNPALGWRGIRAMLDMEPIFKTQIRAILKSSHLKNLKIMLPMISDATEVERAKKLIQQVKFQLRREKVEFDPDIEVGIMIEVPSAALMADTLASKVDFMSIGTNDLTQYTLAADRQNNKVSKLYNAFHPSILHLICRTVKAAKKQSIPVSICGEIAGDLLALPLFIGMGVDLLSMNPGRLFDLCRLVKKIDSSAAEHLTESVIHSKSAQDVMNILQHYKNELEKKPNRKRK